MPSKFNSSQNSDRWNRFCERITHWTNPCIHRCSIPVIRISGVHTILYYIDLDNKFHPWSNIHYLVNILAYTMPFVMIMDIDQNLCENRKKQFLSLQFCHLNYEMSTMKIWTRKLAVILQNYNGHLPYSMQWRQYNIRNIMHTYWLHQS